MLSQDRTCALSRQWPFKVSCVSEHTKSRTSFACNQDIKEGIPQRNCRFYFPLKRNKTKHKLILHENIHATSLHFTCPLAPRWRIGPPHVLSIDSCLALQCAPLSRTATLLRTSPFLLCAARLFLAGLSFSFLLRSMSGL